MRNRWILLGGAAALLISATLATCGDEGPSKEDYAQDLDKICASAEDRFQELDNANPDSLTELERLVTRIKSAGNAAIAKMEDLERPDGDAGEQAQRYLTASRREWEQQAVPALDQLVDAARQRDELKLRSAVRKLDALQNAPSERIAADLGADECAEG